MHKILFAIFIFFTPVLEMALGGALCHAAREYKPVDQLGFGGGAKSSAVSGTHAKQARTQGRAPASFTTPSGAIKLFGTVEFQRPLNSLPGWLDVLKRNSADPVFTDHRQFNKKTDWNQLKQSVSGKSPMDQLRYVNSFWNGWPYREDPANWGKADYWAIPAQFLRKSGDCEDYAIIKYFTLKELGFDPSKMRIVVLRDTVRNLAHAVLAVYMNDDVFILDNLSNVVLSHKRLGNYSPQYSVNEYGRWAHIKGKR